MNEGSGAFSFNDLLAGLLNFDSALQQVKSNTSPPGSILQCEVCKMTYQQFVKVGQFGCAHCYETFREQLTPILKRLHTGNIEHGGKLPKRIGGSLHIKKQVQELKGELQSLVANEEFEQAAKIRDQIRSLEKNYQDGEGNEG
ncbi:hypothetical protein J14TS2_27110 [Bacillus sp. J14TS2]|nr:hypothetical protein J14TS2_27110 [Bacillus sp. J14TS2]